MSARRKITGAVAGALAMASSAQAQAPAPATPATPYAITYIEVASKQANEARKLIRGYRDASRQAPGSASFEVYQRIGYRNHFAFVEQWAGQKAREDYAASEAGKAYRAAITPMLITAYDERPHYALSVGGTSALSGSIHAITHVDIIPPKKDEGVESVRQIAEKSRGTPGNIRFDALVQANRPNHLTIVESWRSRPAQDAHTAAAHTRTFRTNLTPMSGSLYDERLYTLLK